jgi:hypothetical protein
MHQLPLFECPGTHKINVPEPFFPLNISTTNKTAVSTFAPLGSAGRTTPPLPELRTAARPPVAPQPIRSAVAGLAVTLPAVAPQPGLNALTTPPLARPTVLPQPACPTVPPQPACPAAAAAHLATRPLQGSPRRLLVHRLAGRYRRRAPPRACPGRWATHAPLHLVVHMRRQSASRS